MSIASLWSSDLKQVAVAIHHHLQAATPAKVYTVFGFRSASIQHEIAKCRSACHPKALRHFWDRATIIDETQRAPDLLLTIQKTVDEVACSRLDKRANPAAYHL
ncbi:hypothetical protein ACVWXN_006965 [Bradyrhizobium sp. i1.4.4]